MSILDRLSLCLWGALFRRVIALGGGVAYERGGCVRAICGCSMDDLANAMQAEYGSGRIILLIGGPVKTEDGVSQLIYLEYPKHTK